MRVPFSRWMALAVTAISITAISSTGCSTMSRAPGAGWVTGWWHKAPEESYASRTPSPSEKSTPIVATSLGNPSNAPKDPTITPYDGNGTVGTAQPAGGYAAQPAGAIQPNYAATAGAGGAYGGATAGTPAGGYGSYQGATGTQVAPTGGSMYGSPAGGSSVYANAAPQSSPYGGAAAGTPSYQTADARNSSWGGTAPTTPAPAYGGAPQTESSIQPYNGGGYQGGSAQPYGNPTPPPSYTPPASNYSAPSGGYGATTPSSSAPLSQPPADGYSPGSTSRYYADRQQPAPVDGAADMFDDNSVSPAGYQQNPPAAGSYDAGSAYGGSIYGGNTNASAPAAGGYPYP